MPTVEDGGSPSGEAEAEAEEAELPVVEEEMTKLEIGERTEVGGAGRDSVLDELLDDEEEP